jgi:hypothetical protein
MSEGFVVAKGRTDEEITIERVMLRNRDGKPTLTYAPGDDLVVELLYTAKGRIPSPHFWIGVASQYGPVFGANMLLDGCRPDHVEGSGKIVCTFPSIPLLPQLYTMQLGARSADGTGRLIQTREVAFFNVVGTLAEYGYRGELADMISWNSTPVAVPYVWELPDGRRHVVRLERMPEKTA